MPDEQSQPTPVKTTAKGVTVKFSIKDFPDGIPEGVDRETMLFQGVDPETKERVTVTLDGLKAEFGDELGEKKYLAIAGIGGGSQFFHPGTEASTYRPPLGIFQLNEQFRKQVDAILAAKE